MRLNRKQKTIRNFLCILLLLFAWWVFTGMQPFTVSQALRWEAQELGLKETPRVLYRSGRESLIQNTIFAADGQVAVARTEEGLIFAYAMIRDIKSRERTVFFAEEGIQDTVDVYVCTEVPNAATAQCTVTLGGVVNKEPWGNTYTMTADGNENGVFAFKLERTGKKYEETVFWDFCNMVENGQGNMDSRHSVSVTFHDESGNILETYEEVFERT